MLITDSFFGNLLTLFITLPVAIIVYYKWIYQYWKRRNLQYLEPEIPFGNVKLPFSSKEHMAFNVKRLYDIMKRKGWKHGGIYMLLSPIYLVIDLDYTKNIMAKDFQYFTDRGSYYNEKADPLSAHLFHIDGAKWRNLRTKMTPTFTSGKMKMMFQILVDCEKNLVKKMELEYKKPEPIDIKEILGCFTTDIIGSCAFGLDCKTFEENNSPFRVYGKKVFERSFSRQIKKNFVENFPGLGKLFNMTLLPNDLSSFFMKMVEDTVKYREQNKIVRNDFMQMLIDMKNNKLATDEGYKHDGTSLTIEEIAAQSFVFFIAGFETSSTTMTFALYELSKNQDIQDKVRDEINTVLGKYQEKISYEAIQDMKYMNQVIDETLRKYPPGALLSRKCVKDYKVPNTDIVIVKGTTVFISVLGIHYDEELYPDPEKFDPERFSEENKSSRHSYTHIPFGEGPRICIGMRFGLMQTKVGLTSLLRNFRFTLNKKTQEPLKMKPNSTVLAAQGEIWLDAKKI